LLDPEDVIGPYDVYLADQSPGYKKAWGEFVIAQLAQWSPTLRGLTVEVHAGAAYVDPLRVPLAARGGELVAPLAHLRQGEQLAWYDLPRASRSPAPSSPETPSRSDSADARQLAQILGDHSKALPPNEFLARAATACRCQACIPGG
jgi:hypothetical protein